METTRQKKVGVFLRKDITEILQKLLKETSITSTIVSVTKVRVSQDLSLRKTLFHSMII